MVAPRSLALVEVAKREGGPWYEAILRDLQFDKAWVAFDKGVWPSREVPCRQVRQRRKAAPCLVDGAEVEARFPATAENPAFWCSAFVVQEAKEEAHTAVAYVCYVSGKGELTLPLEALRAPSEEPSLNPLAFTRVAMEVEPSLRAWLSLGDCRGCLEQIRSVCSLHLATPGVQNPDGGNGVVVQELDSIILLGSDEATARAQMVVKIHLQHQEEVEAFHRRRRKKLALLQELEAKSVGKDATISFEVQQELVGRTCGRAGERVQRIEKECEVEVRLAGDDEALQKTFLIYGEPKKAQAARDALELHRLEYKLSEESLAWFRKDNRILMDIAKKAELAAANLQDEGLELLGAVSSLEDAQMLLENHLEYLPVYQEMDRQQEEIQRSFEALEASKPTGVAKATSKPKAKASSSRAQRGRAIGS